MLEILKFEDWFSIVLRAQTKGSCSELVYPTVGERFCSVCFFFFLQVRFGLT